MCAAELPYGVLETQDINLNKDKAKRKLSNYTLFVLTR